MFNTYFKRYFHLISKATPNKCAIKIETHCVEKDIVSSSISASRYKPFQQIPLFTQLFKIEEVEHIYATPTFITVSVKDHLDVINHLSPIEQSITNVYYTQILDEFLPDKKAHTINEPIAEIKTYTPFELELSATIDEYIRPNLIEDGGNIRIGHYDESSGILYVQLEGSCKTCTSSYITLKNNVENVLQYYHPEVKEVKEIE